MSISQKQISIYEVLHFSLRSERVPFILTWTNPLVKKFNIKAGIGLIGLILNLISNLMILDF